MTDPFTRYFPELPADRLDKFRMLKPVYEHWNSMINVISRKDMDNFDIHHVLHSLAIGKIVSFAGGTRILDVGTGGGFPGIPLAILFPGSSFTLLDSIAKKIKVVEAVVRELDLKNVTVARKRAEEETIKYDFVVSRAVTDFVSFVRLTRKNISGSGFNSLKNGIIYLKGGDLDEELGQYRNQVMIRDIKDLFSEPFFETKKIVYLPC